MIGRQAHGTRKASERRMFARYEMSGAIRCDLEVAGSLHAFLVDDLSLTGMRLTSHSAQLYGQIRVGERIRIQEASDEDARFLRGVRVDVVWFAGSEDWLVLGVQFAAPLSLSPEVLGCLQRTKTSSRSFDQPTSTIEH